VHQGERATRTGTKFNIGSVPGRRNDVDTVALQFRVEFNLPGLAAQRYIGNIFHLR
jgi:hypothetical protein